MSEPLDILHPLSSLEWDELPSLPFGVSEAQMVCLNGTVYVGGGLVKDGSDAKLFSLRPGVDRSWTVIETPTVYYALVVHDSKLLLVGGIEHSQETNRIYTLNNRSFTELLPPMKEKRSWPSAISTGSVLIVAGGYDASGRDTLFVEVLKDGEWKTAPPLPKKCARMNSAFDGKHWTLKYYQNVFTVSVESLISGTDQSPWETLPELPNFDPSIAYFGGHLVSISGDKYRDLVNKILAFSLHSNSWVELTDANMPKDMVVSSSCAIKLPSGELVGIGRNKGERWDFFGNRVLRAFIKVPLVDPDVRFSVSTLFRMDGYGINLIEELSKDQFRFYAASGVQLLRDDRIRGPSLAAEDYIRMIFETWERSKRPTYPATWEGLFTVLRKMNLGHLVGKIAKCVTGSVPPLDSDKAAEKDTDEVRLLKEKIDGLKADLEEVREDNYQLSRENADMTKEFLQLRKEISRLKEEKSQLGEKLYSVCTDSMIPSLDSGSMKKDLMESLSELKSESTSYYDRLSPATTLKPEPTTTSVPLTEVKPFGERPEKTTGLRSRIEDQEFDLPGVEVVGRTSLTVTNSVQSFHWAGYGFKLHIPQDSLPAGVDQCRLDIIASVAGQYQLPDNYEFFSAVCWVRPTPLCKFLKKLTIKMQHCAKVVPSSNLTFVRAVCSQKSLPYMFEMPRKQKWRPWRSSDSFTEQSSYGILEVDHFSGYAVAGKDVERLYNASFFNLSRNPWTLEIYFTITWDDEIHVNAAKKYFDEMGAKEKSSMEVEFKKDTISLDIPMSGGTTVGEWNLLPIQTPCIRRRTVDSFQPGKNIGTRCRKLTATLPRGTPANIPARFHLVTLEGAREPNNQMRIEINEFDPAQSANITTTIQPMSASSSVVPFRSLAAGSIDVQELSIRDLDEVHAATNPASTKWFNLGLALGVEYDTLQGLSDKYGSNEDRLCHMLATRLRMPNPLTWTMLCSCLRKGTVNRHDVANRIEDTQRLPREDTPPLSPPTSATNKSGVPESKHF